MMPGFLKRLGSLYTLSPNPLLFSPQVPNSLVALKSGGMGLPFNALTHHPGRLPLFPLPFQWAREERLPRVK